MKSIFNQKFMGSLGLPFDKLRVRSGQGAKDQKGMTLIETIVALGILIMGITASLSLMISSINFSKQAERSIVVTNLAREGLEIVRTLRDYNKTIDFNSFENLGTGNFIAHVNNDGELQLDDEGVGEEIDDCVVCEIYLDNDGKYNHDSGGTDTFYRRLISISDVVVGEEKKVISKIYWVDRGREHNYELETRLTNW